MIHLSQDSQNAINQFLENWIINQCVEGLSTVFNQIICISNTANIPNSFHRNRLILNSATFWTRQPLSFDFVLKIISLHQTSYEIVLKNRKQFRVFYPMSRHKYFRTNHSQFINTGTESLEIQNLKSSHVNRLHHLHCSIIIWNWK